MEAATIRFAFGWRRWTGATREAWEAWVEAERGRFAPWLAVFMTAGAVAWLSLPADPPAVLAPTVAVGATLLALLLPRVLPSPAARAAAATLAAFALGATSAEFAAARAAPLIELPRRASIITGIVAAVDDLPRGRRVTIDAPSFDGAAAEPRAVRIRLHNGDATALAPGDGVRLRALLQPPSSPAYPGGWDLQRDAWFAGLGGYGYALGVAEPVAAAPPAGLAGGLRRLREGIAARIRAVLPGSEGAIAATLLSGLATSIPPDVRAAFRDAGLAHLLAIAGLHIGIVMGLAFGTVRLGLALSERAALFWPLKEIAAVAALLAGAGYMLLTGAHVPIMRSFAMAALVTLGVLVGRRALSLRGLALAMAAVVAIAPQETVGVSFQMSFAAVLALISGYARLRPWLLRLGGEGSWRRRLAGYAIALALTSLLAGTASAPYGAYHFGRVQLYYVVGNLIAVPLTALWVMPAGLIALALMPLHAEALALVPMGWGIDAIIAVGRAVSGLPSAVVSVPHMPAWGLVVLSLGLAWCGIWRTRVALLGIPALALGLASPALETRADLLVSADARLIALRTPAGVFVERGNGASNFTLDSWLTYWAVPDATRLPAEGAAGEGIACTGGVCTLRARPDGPVVTLLRRDVSIATCDGVLLVSPEPIRKRCRVPKIDRFTVWREGAQAVWLDTAGLRVETDRATRGARPWVAPVPGKGQGRPAGVVLRPAGTETLSGE